MIYEFKIYGTLSIRLATNDPKAKRPFKETAADGDNMRKKSRTINRPRTIIVLKIQKHGKTKNDLSNND